MPKKAPLDKRQYSESSKCSVGFEYLGSHYADIHYQCEKCKRNAVFSAKEQKQVYEVRKEYMWTKRKLCDACWCEMKQVKKVLAQFEQNYLDNKALLEDASFLIEWLKLLELYPKYGKKGNPSRITFVKKHLGLLIE